MLWPLERAVHSRDVEQRLMNLDVQLFRLQQELLSLPIGYAPTSNNFPLPPIENDTCSLTCISGTPTIPVGASFAFRRHSITGANATGPVNLDWDASAGAWISGIIPLITPLVCSSQSVNLRWKMTAAGVGVGEVTLILQYQVPIIGPTWNNGPTWLNTKVWNPYCGLSFTGGDDFDPGLSCNQAAPEDVCVNPVNLCEGEHTKFFDPSRVFTFTVAGISGTGCTGFNRTWTLDYPGSGNVWDETFFPGVGIFTYSARIIQPNAPAQAGFASLIFRVNAADNVTYKVNACDIPIPGVITFDRQGSGTCTGWPSTLSVTVS